MHMAKYFSTEGKSLLCEENNKDCNESSIGFMQGLYFQLNFNFIMISFNYWVGPNMKMQQCEINTDNTGLACALQINQHFNASIKE